MAETELGSANTEERGMWGGFHAPGPSCRPEFCHLLQPSLPAGLSASVIVTWEVTQRTGPGLLPCPSARLLPVTFLWAVPAAPSAWSRVCMYICYESNGSRGRAKSGGGQLPDPPWEPCPPPRKSVLILCVFPCWSQRCEWFVFRPYMSMFHP